MTKVKDIVATIERIAPLQLQEDYDNAGYQVGNPEAEVSRVLTCLDITEDVIDKAIATNCQLIVAHHPLLFRAIKKITPNDYINRTIIKAIKSDITLYAAHTNLDNAFGGVNYRIAEELGLSNVEILAPLPSGKLTGIENADKCGSGVIGILGSPLSYEEFITKVKTTFHCEHLRTNEATLASSSNLKCKTISRVALCGGSGAEFISDAEKRFADAYITGEIGYHRFFGHENILLLEAGHFETEQFTRDLLKEIIEKSYPEISVEMA
ncbi:MAG: Nif3-like dinuclear metal center hexameric protein [Bacteroidales bacterium]|nr:Nif3-like dinuclear metal center hexameric protein [Bacteroidales bacterium]